MPTPTIAHPEPGNGQIYATPFPYGPGSETPPPIPLPVPTASGSPGPVFLNRSSAPPSIPPAVPYKTPEPTPTPSAEPTLRPGYIAVLADKVTGNAKPGVPGDATGNVHIYYQNDVLVGDRAHYDGVKTITVTGNPYIIDNTKDTVLYADKIVFDTVAEKAYLYKGRGESTQGVETGLVYYSAVDMRTDDHGVSHGNYTAVTTCENSRGGYHLTGRTIDVYPSDKIVITKAVLWLGAAAIFFIPRLVIPLRTVNDQRQRPQVFPDMGYNQLQGAYIRTKLGFGKDQYYYGTYDIEFYTRQGLTLGYDAQIAKKNGKRITQVNVQRVENHLPGESSTNYNAVVQDQENFSQTLRGQLGLSYQSAYGPYTTFPTTEQYNASVTHATIHDNQNYTFSSNTSAGSAQTQTYGFTDGRTFATDMDNQFSFAVSHSATYGAFTSTNNTTAFNDLLHWSTGGADYQLTYDKTLAATPFGINKEPELQIRPNEFMPHFIFPIAPTFTVGEYNEPQTPETTGRADMAFDMGPLLYRLYGSDFSASVNVEQFYYATGDEKATVTQEATLTTPFGRHVVNVINYNEQNFNGPSAVPFTTLDVLSGINTKNATDLVTLSNSDNYNLQLSFTTQFDRQAQPVAYTLTTRPSARSYASINGTFIPGSGNGFPLTNFQVVTPFGRDSWIQFLGDFNWKEGARIENKSIFYSHIIGNCYEVQFAYNQAASTFNVTAFILAFPSHAGAINLNTSGQVVPSSFNGINGL